MLTPEGAALLLQIATSGSEDEINGGLRVSDGTNVATTEVIETRLDGGTVTLVGVFAEGFANFEWRIIEVVSKDNVVVDRAEADQGRKVAGAVWTLETSIELAPAPS